MEIGGGGEPDLQNKKKKHHFIFTGGVDFPLTPTLKISGPWVGAFDVSDLDDFSFHRRPYTWKLGGTGSSKLDKITSLYFYRGRRLS